MIDTPSKLLERIICKKLEAFLRESLSDHQFGFRKARLTIDAIEMVIATAKDANNAGWEGDKVYCVIITLDVKNAFNSAD